MKTKRAAAKRFRATGAGHFKHARKGKRHNLSNKSRRRKRPLGGMKLVHASDEPRVQRMMPYA
ncbi:MAG TPA: 50S ribosomal protein L35 [Myxococcales bacterium LLY-WYZ-16_1]|nr:50S ribosomal protein L35 [Myxococcales bacterium LLY-WYZ-16_1]